MGKIGKSWINNILMGVIAGCGLTGVVYFCYFLQCVYMAPEWTVHTLKSS